MQRILAGLYYSTKPPPLPFLIIHVRPHTAGWRWACHCQGRNKGMTIIYAIFSWINNVLNILGNTLKIQNELVGFLQMVWSSPESPDNVAGEAWDVRLPVGRKRGTVQKERVTKYILKSGGLGLVGGSPTPQILGGVGEPRVLPAIFTSTPYFLMSWIAFYKHSLCFITAGYAVSLLWRCRVTLD